MRLLKFRTTKQPKQPSSAFNEIVEIVMFILHMAANQKLSQYYERTTFPRDMLANTTHTNTHTFIRTRENQNRQTNSTLVSLLIAILMDIQCIDLD